MRLIALSVLLVSIAVFAASCGGPDDPERRLADACERQLEEVAEQAKEGSTPVAKSSQEAQDEVTLVECAGQDVDVVAAGDSKDEKMDGEETAGDADSEGESTEDAGEAPAPAELDPEARSLFASTCGGCHALSDAETSGAVGPNLDETTLDAAGIADKIENGGGGMPPGLLQGEEAQSVADYVAGAASAE